jgi:hypothetical protein
MTDPSFRQIGTDYQFVGEERSLLLLGLGSGLRNLGNRCLRKEVLVVDGLGRLIALGKK